MKTYYIDGNTMHLAGSQVDISDSFFGSECPDSNATDAQRQDAIRFWISEGWMDEGDVVVWDGVRYIVGEGDKMKTLEKRMRAFVSSAPQDELIEMLDEAFRLSMVDYYPQASVLWLEGGKVHMDSFLSDEEALDECSRHTVAFFVPKSWHITADWIWVEKDENPESETFGEDLWCCDDYDGVARYRRMEDMWEYVLDYHNPDWLSEADSVIEYVGKLGAK